MSGEDTDLSSDEGGTPLANYEVLSAGQGAKGEALYTVRRAGAKKEAPLFDWRATRWTGKSIESLKGELKRLKNLESPNLRVPKRPRFHEASGTLYTVTLNTPHPSISQLIQRCKDGNYNFRENFIWKVLHQVASVCDRLQSIRLMHWRKRFDSTRIFVDPDGELILDPFIPKTNQKECGNDICKLGKTLYEMVSLNEYTDENDPITCSEDLKKMIKDLLYCISNPTGCKISYEIILYHPTVLCHLDNSKEIFTGGPLLEKSSTTNDSAFESDESKNESSIKILNNSIKTLCSNRPSITENDLSPNLLALDLKLPGYVPKRQSDAGIDKWKSRLDLCKEPHEVSEDALSRVWLDRLKILRERERLVELKEREINKQKLFDEIRSKILYEDHSTPINPIKEQLITPGITLQTVMNEKVLSNVEKCETEIDFEFKNILPYNLNKKFDPIQQNRSKRSNSKGRCRKKIVMNYEDMDSSLSADQGDYSIVMTSSKLSADLVPRPSSICSMARKKVHFTSRNNPFAEYDDVSSKIFTFDNNNSYEVPIQLPQNNESITDRISKFTYLDLEAITNKKREKMEEARKLQSDSDLKMINDQKVKAPVVKRKSRRSKYFSPGLESQNVYNAESSGSSVLSYQCTKKAKDNRKSMPFLTMNVKKDTPKKILQSGTTLTLLNNNGRITRSKTSVLNGNNESKLSLPCKNESDKSSNKENAQTPKFKRDSKRMSILGFKTPFKFHF